MALLPFLSGSTVPLNGSQMIAGQPIGRWATADPRRFTATFGATTVPTPGLHNVTQYGGTPWRDQTMRTPEPAEIPVEPDSSDMLGSGGYGQLTQGMMGDPRMGALFNSNSLARQLSAQRMQLMMSMMGRRFM